MDNETRQGPGPSSRTKRRHTVADTDRDGRQNPADDASHPKRQRVSRACDSCRSKKDRCDGAQPVCSTCSVLVRACTYKANPKKRGIPTGYIRTIELLWGLVFCKVHGSEEVVLALLKVADIPSRLAAMGKEAEGSDTFMCSWKNSTVLRKIEKLLAPLDQPEDERDRMNRNPGDDGDGSPQEPEDSSMLPLDTLEWRLPEALEGGDGRPFPTVLSPNKTPTNNSTGRNPASGASEDNGITQNRPTESRADNRPLDESSRQPRDIKTSQEPRQYQLHIPSNAFSLFEIYFSYTQCWFPILEKHDILRTAFRYPEEGIQVSPLSAGSGDHAALWAVLALASTQEASGGNTRRRADNPGSRPNPSILYEITKSLIHLESGAYEMGHVQALLVLSLVRIGRQQWAAAWMLVGQAIRLAQLLGLDSKQPETGRSSRSNHVFLGCFLLETLIAVQKCRMPSLRTNDLSKVSPVNEDGLEEWHPWEDQTDFRPGKLGRGSFHRGPLHGLSTFNRLVSLVSILNEWCCARYGPASSLPQLELLDRQLHSWITTLPKSYRVDVQADSAKVASPHIFGLEMMYEGIAIVLNISLTMRASGGDVAETLEKRRATESMKRLILLFQTYSKTYRLCTTPPTFGMILALGTQPPWDDSSSYDFEPSLKDKLRLLSSRVSQVWFPPGSAVEQTCTTEKSQKADATSIMGNNFHGNPAIRNQTHQGSLLDNAVAAQAPQPQAAMSASRDEVVANPTNQGRTEFTAASDSFFPHSWLRTPNSIEDTNTSLLQSPPSLFPHPRRAPGSSYQPSHPRYLGSEGLRTIYSTAGKPVNSASMLPELSPPSNSDALQYRPGGSLSHPNMGNCTFVDAGEYGLPRRQRIAPDLDALFDELASLDGTEKADNQPEFMQNLGFLPDAGIPEFSSYPDRLEPFPLDPTQHASEPSHSRR